MKLVTPRASILIRDEREDEAEGIVYCLLPPEFEKYNSILNQFKQNRHLVPESETVQCTLVVDTGIRDERGYMVIDTLDMFKELSYTIPIKYIVGVFIKVP